MFGVRPAHLISSTNAVIRRVLAEFGAAFEHTGAGHPVVIGSDAYAIFRNVGSVEAAALACKAPIKVAGNTLTVVALQSSPVVLLELRGGAPPQLSPEEVCAAVFDMEGIELRPGPDSSTFVAPDAAAAAQICDPAWQMSVCAGSSVVGFSTRWEVVDTLGRGSAPAAVVTAVPVISRPAAAAAVSSSAVPSSQHFLLRAPLPVPPRAELEPATGRPAAMPLARSHSPAPALVSSALSWGGEATKPSSAPPAPAMSRRIVIPALHPAVPMDELHSLLCAAGPVALLALGSPVVFGGGASSRTAFVEYATDAAVAAAMRTLPGMLWMGKPLTLLPATPSSPSAPFPPPEAEPCDVYPEGNAAAQPCHRRLVFKGLPGTTTATALLALTGAGPELEHLLLGPASGGFRVAYAEYRSAACADAARAALDGCDYFGARVRVESPGATQAGGPMWPPPAEGPFVAANLALARAPPASSDASSEPRSTAIRTSMPQARTSGDAMGPVSTNQAAASQRPAAAAVYSQAPRAVRDPDPTRRAWLDDLSPAHRFLINQAMRAMRIAGAYSAATALKLNGFYGRLLNPTGQDPSKRALYAQLPASGRDLDTLIVDLASRSGGELSILRTRDEQPAMYMPAAARGESPSPLASRASAADHSASFADSEFSRRLILSVAVAATTAEIFRLLDAYGELEMMAVGIPKGDTRRVYCRFLSAACARAAFNGIRCDTRLGDAIVVPSLALPNAIGKPFPSPNAGPVDIVDVRELRGAGSGKRVIELSRSPHVRETGERRVLFSGVPSRTRFQDFRGPLQACGPVEMLALGTNVAYVTFKHASGAARATAASQLTLPTGRVSVKAFSPSVWGMAPWPPPKARLDDGRPYGKEDRRGGDEEGRAIVVIKKARATTSEGAAVSRDVSDALQPPRYTHEEHDELGGDRPSAGSTVSEPGDYSAAAEPTRPAGFGNDAVSGDVCWSTHHDVSPEGDHVGDHATAAGSKRRRSPSPSS